MRTQLCADVWRLVFPESRNAVRVLFMGGKKHPEVCEHTGCRARYTMIGCPKISTKFRDNPRKNK